MERPWKYNGLGLKKIIMKILINCLGMIFIFISCAPQSTMEISNLRCEYKVNPLGVDIKEPRFSWILESTSRGAAQSAYQIFIASGLQKLNSQVDIWDSKLVQSNESIQIVYEGTPLESNKKYYWKVKVWNQDGQIFESAPAFWTTGLLNESDWNAKWIGFDKAIGDDQADGYFRNLSARMLRHEFNINKKIISATAFICGLGMFELYINGDKIGDQVLSPALTEYDKTAFYMAFDITTNLQSAQNAIGVILGSGRYFAPRGYEPKRTTTYGFPKAICQIEIEYEDGSTERVISNESWKLITNGPIRKNNEYDGEYYDAQMELKGWTNTGFDDSDWMNAETVEKPGDKLIAQPNEAIKITKVIDPIALNELKPSVFIFDMGQNMVGWVELFVKGKKDDKVTLRFAEALNPDGSLFVKNLRSAAATDTYVLKGEGEEVWQPRFTYHGFRYVEMTGYPGAPTLSSLKGKVVNDALDEVGAFTCSNPLVNKIYKNAYWGILGNYKGIPVDCPQRDERHGWLGDRSVECIGESFLFNIAGFYNKWLDDIKDTQLESGSLPNIAPTSWPRYDDNATWPSTYLFVPQMLYNHYGDLRVIETHYPHMKKWITYMSQFLEDGIMPLDKYGDWCVPPADINLIFTKDPTKITSAAYLGTSYFYFELRLMDKFALLLGEEEDAKTYRKQADEIKIAFNQKFLDKKNIVYGNNTHTANILALAFDLAPDEYRDQIVENLIHKIDVESNGHIGNGLIGGQWLMRTLTNTGHVDIAYDLLIQKEYPGWGYMVEQGATTIWELWNGDHGGPSMNSRNHVMLLGDLIIWYYESLAGIKADPLNPGFKHIIMKPHIVGDLTFVNASYQSIRGLIKSEWEIKEGQFKWDIEIPANTTATIYVPALAKEIVKEDGELAQNSDGIKFKEWKYNRAIFEIESGKYSFTTKRKDIRHNN